MSVTLFDNPHTSDETLSRWLFRLSTGVVPPITQYGNNSVGTGNSGSVIVTIPTAYTSVSSYNVFVTHSNTTPCNVSVVNTTNNSFTIYWTNAGLGTQQFAWMTIGT